MSGVVEKGGARDAAQVLANGGVFALCALASALTPLPAASWLGAAALGALGAATADTWATEAGVLLGGTPRSLLGFASVPRGTSGAVSATGCVAMVAGAAFIAIVARSLGLTNLVPLVFAAGIAGAMTDSLLGATLQERRWCASCEAATERRLHDCGAATSHAGGVRRLDNDLVNLAATMAGAFVVMAGLIVREW